ncbi:RNA polymerase sigma factor [Streptomyces sp. NPDC055955]|uniref:RNA polymerase sigma factor n=1 Tax=Streptomyces sp. NPDC055955 TaxID=3345665 RepID=UPI0035E20CEC
MATEPWSTRRGAPHDGHESWPRIWSHREQLLEVARRGSVSAEDAEDAVHEAMLRALERPGLDDERLGDWLRTVTVRLCADRQQQVRREVEAGRRALAATAGAAPLDEVVCDREEARWLARRSVRLPARQAEALRLRAEDLDVGQVARRMGLSRRTVESLLARARRTLRHVLAGTLAVWSWVYPVRRLSAAGQAAVASTTAAVAVLGLAVPVPSRLPAPPRPAPSAVRQAHPVPTSSVPEPHRVDEVVTAVPAATGSAADSGRGARPGSGSSVRPAAGLTGLGSGLSVESVMPRVGVSSGPRLPSLPSPSSYPSYPSYRSHPSCPPQPSLSEQPSAAELRLPSVPMASEVPTTLPSAPTSDAGAFDAVPHDGVPSSG